MSEPNLYKEYTDDSVLNCTPLGLIVALYQGAIDNLIIARNCLANRDIPGRTKAINKTYSILSELLMALDKKKGGEISKNLGVLYLYMQRRVLEAQLKQTAAPLEEVQKLLSTILEGWKEASRTLDPLASFNAAAAATTYGQPAKAQGYESVGGEGVSGDAVTYGGYFDYGDSGGRQAYSF